MTTAISADDDPRTASGRTILVYEAPVRLWHWVNALCITVLAVTGYLIASPLPSLHGEASAHFEMGYIRFAHFAAAQIFVVGFLFRVYWAFAGNEHARQLFVLPVWRAAWWRDMIGELRWYLFLEKRPKKFIGHNPLAHFFMFLFVTIGSTFMIFTGLALYGEGEGATSWQSHLFGWVIPLFGGSQAVHSWHHLGMWGIVCFVMLHVYAGVREDIMSRQSLIGSMFSGLRTFRD